MLGSNLVPSIASNLTTEPSLLPRPSLWAIILVTSSSFLLKSFIFRVTTQKEGISVFHLYIWEVALDLHDFGSSMCGTWVKAPKPRGWTLFWPYSADDHTIRLASPFHTHSMDYVGPKLFSLMTAASPKSVLVENTSVYVTLCPRFSIKKAAALPFSIPIGLLRSSGYPKPQQDMKREGTGSVPLVVPTENPNGISNNIMLTSLDYRWKPAPHGNHHLQVQKLWWDWVCPESQPSFLSFINRSWPFCLWFQRLISFGLLLVLRSVHHKTGKQRGALQNLWSV